MSVELSMLMWSGVLLLVLIVMSANAGIMAMGLPWGFSNRDVAYSYTIPAGQGNIPPIANNDSASVVTGGSVVVNVLANDSDANNHTLMVTAVTQGSSGSVTTNGTTVTYNHDGSATTSDSFTYAISDGNDGSEFTDGHISTKLYDTIAAAMCIKREQQNTKFVTFARQAGGDDFLAIILQILMMQARADLVAQVDAEEVFFGYSAFIGRPELAELLEQWHDEPVGDDIDRV